VNRNFAARPTLLVTMGGSDPLGPHRAHRPGAGPDCARPSASVLSSAPAWRTAPKVAARIAACRRNYETVEGADDLSTEYANADLALCAFGVTAYELAAHGVRRFISASAKTMRVPRPPSPSRHGRVARCRR